MPSVLAPGVAQLTMKGQIGAQPWATIMHFTAASGTPTWTVAQCTALTSTAWSSWTSRLTGLASSNVDLREADAVDIGSATGASSSDVRTRVPGAAGTALEPSSLCQTIQYKINARYRGGHPRGYWPFGNSTLMLNESTWSTGAISATATAFPNFVDDILAALVAAGISGALQCVPRYTYTYTNDPVHHKYLKERTGYLRADPVVNWIVRPTVGSQRRRLTL